MCQDLSNALFSYYYHWWTVRFSLWSHYQTMQWMENSPFSGSSGSDDDDFLWPLRQPYQHSVPQHFNATGPYYPDILHIMLQHFASKVPERQQTDILLHHHNTHLHVSSFSSNFLHKKSSELYHILPVTQIWHLEIFGSF